MRYFLELAYKGTAFHGYQVQPDQITVQAQIEHALATILRVPTPVVGCGRTDTGVHAAQYYLHFDGPEGLDARFVHRLNGLVGVDIAIYKLHQVDAQAHARFDATSRSYDYFVGLQKNPFRRETAYFCPFHREVDWARMQAAAQVLLNYTEFKPFCKTRSDAHTYRCTLTEATWHNEGGQWRFRITANRFLRGMVRLVVGACLNVGRGKLDLDALIEAMDTQEPLKRPFAVPAQGLFLTDIHYPYIEANPSSAW